MVRKIQQRRSLGSADRSSGAECFEVDLSAVYSVGSRIWDPFELLKYVVGVNAVMTERICVVLAFHSSKRKFIVSYVSDIFHVR